MRDRLQDTPRIGVLSHNAHLWSDGIYRTTPETQNIDNMEIISIMVTRLEADEIRKAASIIKKRNGSRGLSLQEYLLLLHNDWLVRREDIPEQATGVHLLHLGAKT